MFKVNNKDTSTTSLTIGGVLHLVKLQASASMDTFFIYEVLKYVKLYIKMVVI